MIRYRTERAGDAPCYARFGFAHAPVADLALPGPVESDRVLGLDLVPGALAGAGGVIAAAGLKIGHATRCRPVVPVANAPLAT